MDYIVMGIFGAVILFAFVWTVMRIARPPGNQYEYATATDEDGNTIEVVVDLSDK